MTHLSTNQPNPSMINHLSTIWRWWYNWLQVWSQFTNTCQKIAKYLKSRWGSPFETLRCLCQKSFSKFYLKCVYVLFCWVKWLIILFPYRFPHNCSPCGRISFVILTCGLKFKSWPILTFWIASHDCSDLILRTAVTDEGLNAFNSIHRS